MSKSLQVGKFSKHRDNKACSFSQEDTAGAKMSTTSRRIVPRINQTRVVTQEHQQGAATTVAATTTRIA